MDIDLRSSEDGDWEALYVNGRKMAEGQSLTAERVIRALGFTVRTDKSYTEQQLDKIGMEFPEELDQEPK